MSNECKIIMSLLEDYIKLKEDYKEYNKENLYDVFNLFQAELFELCDVVYDVDKKIDKIRLQGYTDGNEIMEIIEENEENLVNEIADVLLTTARLIKTFKLEEPLIEMMEYKLHRQTIREEKIKNYQKITG